MSNFNSEIHHRSSIRLRGYDYTKEGIYFITICTKNKTCLLGEINDRGLELNYIGQIIKEYWEGIKLHFKNIELDAYTVMPNHIHGILTIQSAENNVVVGARHAVPQQRQQPRQIERFGKPVSGSLPTIIRSFKSASTKRINEHFRSSGSKIWQRNYYEHIIRSERELDQIREYIIYNSARWAEDKYNPASL